MQETEIHFRTHTASASRIELLSNMHWASNITCAEYKHKGLRKIVRVFSLYCKQVYGTLLWHHQSLPRDSLHMNSGIDKECARWKSFSFILASRRSFPTTVYVLITVNEPLEVNNLLLREPILVINIILQLTARLFAPFLILRQSDK